MAATKRSARNVDPPPVDDDGPAPPRLPYTLNLDGPARIEEPETGRLLLKLTGIEPSEDNPRAAMDPDALQELARSIQDVGVLQPILVRPFEDMALSVTRYRVIAGHRRVAAAHLAGLSHVPATIAADVDDAQALRLAILENLQRVDLDPIEEARVFQQLVALGTKQKDLAAQVHKSPPVVANAIRLLKLPEDVLQLVSAGTLGIAHAVALVRFAAFPEAVTLMAQLAVENETRSRELEKGVPFAHHLEGGQVFTGKGYATYPVHIQRFGYSEDGGFAECKACPFGAFFKDGSNYSAYCFKPDHYAELRDAARRQRELDQAHLLESQRATLVEQARRAVVVDLQAEGATTSPGVVQEEAETMVPEDAPIEQLIERIPVYDGMTMERLDWSRPPATCTDECPCRRKVLSSGTLITVCVDKKRLSKLRSATTRQEKKGARSAATTYTERMTAAIDAITAVGPREIALLAYAFGARLQNDFRTRRNFEKAAARQGQPTDQSANLQWIATREPVVAARLVIEALVRAELENLTDPQYSATAPLPEQAPARYPALLYLLDGTLPAAESDDGVIVEEPDDDDGAVCVLCGNDGHTTAEHAAQEAADDTPLEAAHA